MNPPWRIMHVVAGVALFLVLSLLMIPPIAAQGGTDSETKDCDTCDTWLGYQHSFWNISNCTSGEACYSCTGVEGCHGTWRAFTCDSVHTKCGASRALLESVRKAAELGDGPVLLATLRLNRGKVILNRERAVLQVTNCKGLIVAQYPLRRTSISATGAMAL